MKIGDEVDLFIEERENAMGQLVLSRRKAKLVKGWQYVQEAVEDAALSFGDLMLITGPITVGMYLARLVVGNLMGGGPEIGFKGIKVAMVPGFGVVEGFYRTFKVLIIGAISGFLYSVLAVLLFSVTHPVETLQFIGGSVVGIFQLIINLLS